MLTLTLSAALALHISLHFLLSCNSWLMDSGRTLGPQTTDAMKLFQVGCTTITHLRTAGAWNRTWCLLDLSTNISTACSKNPPESYRPIHAKPRQEVQCCHKSKVLCLEGHTQIFALCLHCSFSSCWLAVCIVLEAF